MPSPARHHAEWLSLLEISGPFLSLPVLLDVFPQGLEAHDSDLAHSLRAAHEEWADNQGGLRPDPAIHTAWMRYVLTDVLEFNAAALLEGQGIPAALMAEVPEHGIRLRPDLALTSPEGVRLLFKVYPASQELDHPPAGSRWKASVATQMMELLHATGVKLGLVTNGEQWMLVHAPKGETTGFISWYAHLWFDEPLILRAFSSLLGARRFFGVPSTETLEAMLARSAQDQHEVTDQLGYQVRQAVEILIRDLDAADSERGRALLADVDEERLYEAALTVMMRLVFLLSAEERKLLPLDDPFYAEYYAVSTLRAQLREAADQLGEDVLERRTDAWNRLLATFRAIYAGVGHDRLKMIAYGGSLFDPDRFPFLEGRPVGTSWRATPADPLPVDNRTVLHLLEALQLLRVDVPGGGKETRRLSFRALDIEQIGHVYEGLLDHIAVRAADPVIGLSGTKDKEPEIPLPELEKYFPRQDARNAKEDQNETLAGFAPLRENEKLIAYLRGQTGRSESALRNGLAAELEALRAQRLRAACGNDEALYRRVAPLAGLIRDDDNGFPVVIPAGGVYVTAGTARRASGTHYTPRSLTEPIVQHTLEPLVYSGPAEGKPREEWVLKTPEGLLALKICDMTVGSGAFLVQVVRYMSERLVEAWELYALTPSPSPKLGEGSGGRGERGEGDDQPLNTDDWLLEAKRLVVDRCIYGVDKNPLAVEMAKLSLWLITLDKNRPFTFLDHALKCGDSLVGAGEADFTRWAHNLRDSAMPLFQEVLDQSLDEARSKRAQLQSFQVLDLRDAERKAALLAEAEAAMARVKLGCDLLVGAKLLGLNQSEQDSLLSRLLLDYVAGEAMDKPDARRAISAACKERAFHWEFEFPEVSSSGGFSAFVGNPPFIGGRRIVTTFGEAYTNYLNITITGWNRNADIVAAFFRRAYYLLGSKSCLGLIATNTIGQADTREAGLDWIINHSGTIYAAHKSKLWPGVASVYVSIAHIIKGDYRGEKFLDNNLVAGISSFLDSQRTFSDEVDTPETLAANLKKSFQGSIPWGIGFVISTKEAKHLLKIERNREVIFPYLTGADLYSAPDQHPKRWVINFGERERLVAEQYEKPFYIVKERVYPFRQKKDSQKYSRAVNEWWKFWNSREYLYHTIKPQSETLAITRVSDTHALVMIPVDWVYADTVVIFAYEDFYHFSILQSSIHEFWARKYGSTLKTDLRYSLTDCFETFPFPNNKSAIENLHSIGETYHEHRRQIMLARQEGLTKTYNRFHDPEEASDDIAQLRELHIEMDQAVAAAYGWDDLQLDHDFQEAPQGVRFTISEAARREALGRLLELNHQRYAEEVEAGLHEKKSGKRQAGSGKRKTAKTKAAAKPKPVPEPKEPPKDQVNFLEMVADSPAVPARPSDAVPGNQIGAWDQCVCILCEKHLAGFQVSEHTKTEHNGKDPGYRRVGK